jgi:hypothetical protein
MNTPKILLCLSILLFGFSARQPAEIPPGAIKGDFDGDGKPEYAWVIKPAINSDSTSCVDTPCVARLVFSNPHIKPIILNNSIGGKLSNLGDLNGDGKDVIGLRPDWFTSCWRNFFTYTLKSGTWQYLVAPFPTHCNQWEDNVKPIEKIPGKKGYVKINYSVFQNNDIVLKSKIVKVL